MSSSHLAAVRFPDGHTLFSVFDDRTGRIEPSLVRQASFNDDEQWAEAQLREHGCDAQTRVRRLFAAGTNSLLGIIADLSDGAEEVLVEVPGTAHRWRSVAHREKQILLTELNPLG
ncbi:hypothetical protein [Eleftheria terrae]|uniref:hypothetical protein n=1 Tax=Eleftheria terrae TaxID=1597781 RepID=UPI00263A67E8|nr:hypothetical protein [Eleftheria terrae]WKB51059.1 hypothetical protein N7L95_14700 [Eleftheria terrae]